MIKIVMIVWYASTYQGVGMQQIEGWSSKVTCQQEAVHIADIPGHLDAYCIEVK